MKKRTTLIFLGAVAALCLAFTATKGDRCSGGDNVIPSTTYDELEIPLNPEGLEETRRSRASYTVSYNHKTKQPNWVAWILTADETNGPINKKDYDFEDDDDIPDPKGYKSDYFTSGYDRGHLCPAGDNKWDSAAMHDCYLMTNMCPQTSSMNSGIWNSIEKRCRTWAEKYGEIYIVCGPLFIGTDHKTIGKNKVVVPEAFFKVVLCMGDYPKAIGYICYNQGQAGSDISDFVKTVDEIEEVTGYDFFSQLPDSLENHIEGTCDLSLW